MPLEVFPCPEHGYEGCGCFNPPGEVEVEFGLDPFDLAEDYLVALKENQYIQFNDFDKSTIISELVEMMKTYSGG